MKRIIFLVSGSGGTLKFLLNAFELVKIHYQIVGVLGDRDCGALKFAENKKIYCKKIFYNRSNVDELQSELKHLNPDIIITNIHKIIDEDTLYLWHDKFINVHYSLLPSFGGLIGMETVQKAKEQNVKFIGGTCHKVSKVVDAGKIVQQGCFSVDWDNDENVVDTVFKTSCFCLLGGLYNTENNFFESAKINNYEVHFSPNISFDPSKFDNKFWNLIKNNEDDSI